MPNIASFLQSKTRTLCCNTNSAGSRLRRDVRSSDWQHQARNPSVEATRDKVNQCRGLRLDPCRVILVADMRWEVAKFATSLKQGLEKIVDGHLPVGPSNDAIQG